MKHPPTPVSICGWGERADAHIANEKGAGVFVSPAPLLFAQPQHQIDAGKL
jgi:hypothetical protein